MSVAIKRGRAGSQGGTSRRVGAGDPGIFGSIFGGIKRVAGAAINVATGNIGAAGRSLLGARSMPGIVAGPSPRGVELPGFVANVQRAVPGGATGLGIGCGKGFRPNKTSYFLRDGSFIDVGTRCVKSRRRNPANARATSRAISRVNGAKRMQSALAQIETAKFTKAGKKKHHD